MKKATLEAFADELTDEDLGSLLNIVRDRLTVWVSSEYDDSIYPANVLDVHANTDSSGPGVSLLLEDEDDECE